MGMGEEQVTIEGAEQKSRRPSTTEAVTRVALDDDDEDSASQSGGAEEKKTPETEGATAPDPTELHSPPT
jgi:hypothetical protein